MKVTCINANNFANLTEGTVYQVSEETKDLYILVNDLGVSARYHKKFFEEYREKPKIVPPSFSIIRNGSNFFLDITHGPENHRSVERIPFTVSLVSSSCGIASIHNINGLANRLNALEILTEENFQAAIETILREYQYSMVIFSTNDSYPIIWDVMDRICSFSSEERRNPNSNNQIKLWGFYTSEN